jgi:colanic acid/amylovoran biosynthesis protein
MSAVRILVDQSSYDLLNIGDVAMLQSCVVRLKQQWPDAEIMVISYEPGRLASYCPGTYAISRSLADLPLFRLLPRKPRLASAQAWRMTAPHLLGHLGLGHLGRESNVPATPNSVIRAVQAADLVVASGGAYVTDSWWWHAAGVLGLLSLAQRLGKPTAMFGQGIGPISRGTLRAQAAVVLPKLKVIGLREGLIGRDLVLSLGVSADAVTVTGDDAFELIEDTGPAQGNGLGLNVRVSGYAGVESATAAAVGDLVLRAAAEFGAPIVGLPVSRYAADADAVSLRALLSRAPGRVDVVMGDIASPQALISAAASCRAIVTGSYHAAVFGLAQGVPAVCLSKSSYYDAKFGGLQALYPGACFVVPLDAPDYAARLSATILQAWHLPAPARAAAREATAALRECGREAYARFRKEAENPVRPMSGAGAAGGVHGR